MAKYIDCEPLINEFSGGESMKSMAESMADEHFVEALKQAPAADVAEVIHGKWEAGHYQGGIFDGTNFEKCNVCQFERLFEDIRFKTNYNYCPNCGAKMDGGNIK